MMEVLASSAAGCQSYPQMFPASSGSWKGGVLAVFVAQMGVYRVRSSASTLPWLELRPIVVSGSGT